MPKPGGDPSSEISLEDVLRLTKRHPACRRCEAQSGFRMERENLDHRFHETARLQHYAFRPQNAAVSRAAYDSNFGNARLDGDAKGKGTSGSNRETESTDASARGGLLRSGDAAGVMPVERREQAIAIG